ncbi:MAG: PHP-associated domain-containing protein [Candidatus Hydrogenedens sp.]
MSILFSDLHIHSVLSPCADRMMLPQNIYPRLIKKGINAFAICDHNSTRNVRAFYEYGQNWFPQILFLPGIEITTEEEVHVLGIFPDLEDAESVGKIIRETLSEELNKKDFLEPQLIINSKGEVIGEEEKSLYLSSGMNLENVIALLRKYNAMIIASHVDRPSFSITSQLGIIPDNVFDVLEISPISVKRVIEKKEFLLKSIIYSLPQNLPVITSSDAHSIDEIGHVRTEICVDSLTFDGIKKGIRTNTVLEVIEID